VVSLQVRLADTAGLCLEKMMQWDHNKKTKFNVGDKVRVVGKEIWASDLKPVPHEGIIRDIFCLSYLTNKPIYLIDGGRWRFYDDDLRSEKDD